MDISFITLSLVAEDAPSRSPHLEEDIEDSVQDFFIEHIKALEAMSRKPDAPPPGHFIDAEAQALFQDLHTGDADVFLDSAKTLTKRLITRMNKRTTRGLLACVRADGDSGRVSAVLKLEIDPSNGTRLEELASGEIRLASVTNVLDQPGDLQKGVLVTPGTPAEEVLCGDTLTHQARYFPEAFGIQVSARPSRGPAEFVKAAARHDIRLAAPVAAALQKVRPGTLPEIVVELSDHVPALSPEIRESIVDTLEQAPRPITYLDTTKQVIAVIEQDGITIRGAAEVFSEQVRFHETPDGTWEAVISFKNEPKTNYR